MLKGMKSQGERKVRRGRFTKCGEVIYTYEKRKERGFGL